MLTGPLMARVATSWVESKGLDDQGMVVARIGQPAHLMIAVQVSIVRPSPENALVANQYRQTGADFTLGRVPTIGRRQRGLTRGPQAVTEGVADQQSPDSRHRGFGTQNPVAAIGICIPRESVRIIKFQIIAAYPSASAG